MLRVQSVKLICSNKANVLLEQPEDLKSMQFLNDDHNFDRYKIVYKCSLQPILEEHLTIFSGNEIFAVA